VNLFGASVETDMGLADIYESAERWDLAAEFLKRALEKAPSDMSVILRSARIQLRRGDEQDARGLIARARELSPASTEPCALLARWLDAAGRKDEAAAAAAECAPR
jgi:Flp pilus assembly protein TadD